MARPKIVAVEEAFLLSNLLRMLRGLKGGITKKIKKSVNFSKNCHILAAKTPKYQHGRSDLSLDANM
jgi:hypothetical protein